MGIRGGRPGKGEPCVRLKLGVKKELREAGNGQRVLDKEGAVTRLTRLETQTPTGASAPEASTPQRGVHKWRPASAVCLAVPWKVLAWETSDLVAHVTALSDVHRNLTKHCRHSLCADRARGQEG